MSPGTVTSRAARDGNAVSTPASRELGSPIAHGTGSLRVGCLNKGFFWPLEFFAPFPSCYSHSPISFDFTTDLILMHVNSTVWCCEMGGKPGEMALLCWGLGEG